MTVDMCSCVVYFCNCDWFCHVLQAMVMCFKLYFMKDPTISSTAAATVRQMVSVLFDRVVTEDSKDKGKWNNTFVRFSLLHNPQVCGYSTLAHFTSWVSPTARPFVWKLVFSNTSHHKDWHTMLRCGSSRHKAQPILWHHTLWYRNLKN